MRYFILLAVFVLATAQNPIPHRPPKGFVYPTSKCTAPVEFKAFIDLTCPDCKQAWPTFQRVAEYYNKDSKSMVSFESVLFPLPFHRAAFPAAQASYILRNLDASHMYNWFTYIYSHQSKYYNDALLDRNQTVIHELLADDISIATGTSRASVLAHFKDTDPSRKEAIVLWKYACSQTVSGTPTVLLNGVRVDFDLTWTLDDWKKVIDPLLPPDASRYYGPTKCPNGEVECKYLPGKIECCLKGEYCIPNVGCRC